MGRRGLLVLKGLRGPLALDRRVRPGRRGLTARMVSRASLDLRGPLALRALLVRKAPRGCLVRLAMSAAREKTACLVRPARRGLKGLPAATAHRVPLVCPVRLAMSETPASQVLRA
jgi:hypothetical protein